MSVPGGNRLTYRAARLGRRATASTRALPDFVIAGAAKCGTTSLYRYLVEHPLVVAAQIKEIHFVDRQHNLDKGEGWYRSWFPTRAALRRAARGHDAERAICGESTPNYLAHPDAAARLCAVVPDARIIVLLREPIDRVWSQYRWQQRFGGETLALIDALHAEAERVGGGFEMMGADRQTRNRFISHGYLARSCYAEQLEWWFDAFAPEQLLLLRSEDLFADPAAVLARTCDFLGLPAFDLPAYDVKNEGTGARASDGAIDAELRAWLEDYFAEPNRRLADLTRPLPGGAITGP
ncbi:MAG: sulfotransferase family protein [Acidimicrobiales bacterium]